MSGSITDSDACGNDWDETWTPPPVFGKYNIEWKSPWQKFHIKVHFLDGTSTDHVSVCLVPWKMQFFIHHHLQRLQNIIRSINTIDVESINSSTELLEIKIKSNTHDVFSEIETAILNECNDVMMKTVIKHVFTERLAEEICLQLVREKKIDLLSDDTKVFIVGLTEMMNYINKAVNDINRVTVKRNIQWKEKWKMAANIKFGLIGTVAKTFGNDLMIDIQKEKSSIYFHGKDEAVEKAINDLDRLLSVLFVEKIEVNFHLLRLLAFPEASCLFTDILESSRLPVICVIDGEQLFFVSQLQVDKNIIRSAIYANFHEVAFSDSAPNQRDFVTSKAFIDFTNVYINKLLIIERTITGIVLVSTKAIIQELLHLEKMIHLNPSNTKETQVNTEDEKYIRLEKEYKMLANKLKEVESIWKNEMSLRISTEKSLQQCTEKYEREKKYKINLEEKFKAERSDLKKQLEDCKQEIDDKKKNEHELLQRKESLDKMKIHIDRYSTDQADVGASQMKETKSAVNRSKSEFTTNVQAMAAQEGGSGDPLQFPCVTKEQKQEKFKRQPNKYERFMVMSVKKIVGICKNADTGQDHLGSISECVINANNK